MGRVKGRHLKTLAEVLVKKQASLFSTSFAENKRKLKELGLMKQSKEEQNKLVGEITVLMRRKALEEKEAKELKPSEPQAPQAVQ